MLCNAYDDMAVLVFITPGVLHIHQPKKIQMEVEPFKVHLWSSIQHTPRQHHQLPQYRTQPQQGLCHYQYEMANLRKGYTETHRVHGCSQPLYMTPRWKGTTTLQTTEGLWVLFLVRGGWYSLGAAQVVSNEAFDHDGASTRRNSTYLYRRHFSCRKHSYLRRTRGGRTCL